MKFEHRKLMSFSILVSFLVLFAGCGQADSSSTADGSGTVSSLAVNPNATVTAAWDGCAGGYVDTVGSLTRCPRDIVPQGANT